MLIPTNTILFITIVLNRCAEITMFIQVLMKYVAPSGAKLDSQQSNANLLRAVFHNLVHNCYYGCVHR